MENVNRIKEERSVADANSLLLEPSVQSKWENCASTHRFMAFSGKQLVAYNLMFLEPQITDVLTCRGLEVSFSEGLVSTWESQATKETYRVSAVPTEVAENCFLWMLKYSSLELVSHKSAKSLQFSMAYRTLLNPQVEVDGTTYLVEKAIFDHKKKK